jgi:tRNA modification GTPase
MPSLIHLTSPGRSAIATVLVDGAGALDTVAEHVRLASERPLMESQADRPTFGHFGPEPGEEVVIRVRSADSVELHCHGGHAAVTRITELLARSGCTPLDWHHWAHQHHADPITADAHVALAEARTERTARILLDQFHGALRRATDAVVERVREGDLRSARQQLETLLAREALGRHLTRPWQVVLAGPPNAGKSSLINALLGYRRAIVHSVPGTTRDVVTATTAIDGWPVELSDTAGLRDTQHVVEQAGVALAQESLAAADLVVLVFDGSRPWSDDAQSVVALRPDAILVHNKSDLPSAHQPRPAGLWTSAFSGEGIDQLLHTIAQRLVPDPPPTGAAVPFTTAQVETLRAAQAALARNEPDAAAAMLTA